MIFNQMTQATHALIHKIHHHDFNLQLADGSLHQDTFVFYLIQDALYLADFSKALAITAARLPDNAHSQQFIAFALDAIKAERELHFGYINQYQKSHLLDGKTETSPACFMYTNFLLRTASLSSVEEAVASLLPCFYVYHEVGKQMLNNLRPEHPYAKWITLYSSDSFEQSVQSAIEITNQLAAETSDIIRTKMVDAFYKSTQLEWLFWDSAFRFESFKIP